MNSSSRWQNQVNGPGDKVDIKRFIKLGVRLLSRSKFLFTISLLLSLVTIVSSIYQPVILAKLTNLLSGELNKSLISSIKVTTLIFGVIVIINIITQLLSKNITSVITNRTLTILKGELHDKILNQPGGFHKEYTLGRTGAIVNQFSTGAVLTVMQLFSQPIISLLGIILSIRILVNELMSTGSIPLYLEIILLGLILVVPFISYKISNRIKSQSFKQNSAMVQVQEEFNNSGTNPIALQLMEAQSIRSSSFNTALKHDQKVKSKAAFLNNFDSVFNSSISSVLQVVFITILVVFSIDSTTTIYSLSGSIIIFLFLIPKAISPIQQAIGLYTGLNVNWPMLKEVIDILERGDHKDIDRGTVELSGEKSISLENLKFSYTPDSRILLNDINLEIQKGEIIGIVAESGIGKSTLFKLLTKQYGNYSGNIKIGDNNLRDITLSSIRKKILTIPQFPYFITGTVRDNFKLVKSDVTDSEILEISKQTGFYDILQRFSQDHSDPLDTFITRESGGRWSGGERKIFSLTRSLLIDPSIILIDEQVSGLSPLDAERVLGVMKNILNLDQLKGDTILVIEHNPKYLKELCTKIVCLTNDGISEFGTPEELIKKRGLFYSMLNSMEGVDK